ncbi:MAG: bifunctional DNA-formamidopyrimidine glycosylase/DNA-(apurinic or apyrimidinic site) lyase [Candidatus Saccharimonadales bacterium]
MPELPEVETVRRGLHKLIIGKTVKSVDFDWPKSFPNAPGDVAQFLIGAQIIDVRRRAKVLIIDLDSGYSLVIHLKMTGQLVYVRKRESAVTSQRSPVKTEDGRLKTKDFTPEERFGAGHPNDSLIGRLPDKSTRATLHLEDVRGQSSHMYFNDQRKFGWMRLLPTVEVPNIDFFKKVGPEPLSDEFTAKILYERLQKRAKTSIKAALLDQTVLAGVGNIYADESLWGAKIHPASKVADIPKSKIYILYSELRLVLELAIEKGGSTDRNYVNAEGKKGSYIDFARVFRREGKDCPRHPGTVIIKTKVAGRGTHTCPRCQSV